MTRLGQRCSHCVGRVGPGEQRDGRAAPRQPAAPGAGGDTGVERFGGLRDLGETYRLMEPVVGRPDEQRRIVVLDGQRRTVRPDRGCGRRHVARHRPGSEPATGRSTSSSRGSTRSPTLRRDCGPTRNGIARPSTQATTPPNTDAAALSPWPSRRAATSSDRVRARPPSPHAVAAAVHHAPSAASADPRGTAEAEPAPHRDRRTHPERSVGRPRRSTRRTPSRPGGADRRAGRPSGASPTPTSRDSRAPSRARRIRRRGWPTMPAPERRAPRSLGVGLRDADQRVESALGPAVVDRAPRSLEPVGDVGDGTADHEPGRRVEHDDVAMRTGLAARARGGSTSAFSSGSPPRRSSAVAGAKSEVGGVERELGDRAVGECEHRRRSGGGQLVEPVAVHHPGMVQALALQRARPSARRSGGRRHRSPDGARGPDWPSDRAG